MLRYFVRARDFHFLRFTAKMDQNGHSKIEKVNRKKGPSPALRRTLKTKKTKKTLKNQIIKTESNME